MSTDTLEDTALAEAMHCYVLEATRQAQLGRDARDAELRRLHGEGWSVRRLAAALGLSPAAVGKIVNANNNTEG